MKAFLNMSDQHMAPNVTPGSNRTLGSISYISTLLCRLRFMGNGGRDRFHPPTLHLFYSHVQFLLSTVSITPK